MISSTRNATVQSVRRLRKPLFRDRKRLLLAEGIQPLEAALAAGAPVRQVLYLPGAAQRREAVLKEAAAAGAKLHSVSLEVMAHLTSAAAPPELLSVVQLRDASIEAIGGGRGVLLSAVRDPRAVGGIMATAAATGARYAAAARGTADVFGDKVVRAARGAHFILAVVRDVELAHVAERVRRAGGRVVSLSPAGPAPWEVNLRGDVAFAIGEHVDELSDERVCVATDRPGLPITAQAAVVMIEAWRQAPAR